MNKIDKEELNRQIHQRVFLGKGECRNYAGDHNDAFLLVRALEGAGLRLALFVGGFGEGVSADFTDVQDEEVGRGTHNDVPVAICLAALKGIENTKLSFAKK